MSVLGFLYVLGGQMALYWKCGYAVPIEREKKTRTLHPEACPDRDLDAYAEESKKNTLVLHTPKGFGASR